MILDSTKILFFYGAHLASLSCQIIFWRKDSTFVMRAPGYSIGSLTQVALHTQYLNCRLTQKYSWGSRCSWLLNSSNSGVDFSMEFSLFLSLLLFSFYSSFLSLFSFFFFLLLHLLKVSSQPWLWKGIKWVPSVSTISTSCTSINSF